MSDGFMDFGMGSGDDDVGKKSKRFKAESNHAYRVSFCWFSIEGEKGWDDSAAWDKEGKLIPPVFNDERKQTGGAMIRFIGCERIYIPKIGNVLYSSPAFAEFGSPKQQVATIIVVWPTDKEGELDVASFKKGKGYAVMPWHFSPDKYDVIKKQHKRHPLQNHDVLMSCPDKGAEFQKLTFSPETDNLLMKLLSAEKPEYQAIAQKILADVKAIAATMNQDLAKSMTIEQIRQKLAGEDGGSSSGPTSNHASKDVDDLLESL